MSKEGTVFSIEMMNGLEHREGLENDEKIR